MLKKNIYKGPTVPKPTELPPPPPAPKSKTAAKTDNHFNNSPEQDCKEHQC